MRKKYRNSIASIKKFPQFTTMNVIDGQAGLIIYASLIFYSLTVDNILNIIVLLILAGITISSISGDNGLINQAINAKIQTEIDKEHELINIATTQAMGKHKYGSVTKNGLENTLANKFEDGEAEVIDNEDGTFLIICPSQRTYQVRGNGDVTYLGKKEELLRQATIIAQPQSSTTPQLVQKVNVTVTTALNIEDENIMLVYAWSDSPDNQPGEDEYTEATLAGTKRNRTTQVASNATEEGNYYLWTKVIIGENEIDKSFGPYAIKDHTTLVACTSETSSASGYLGNTNIKRNQIESVTIATSLGTHTTSDDNCWDVSASKSGKYLAWYEDTDGDGYYEVTIAGDGGVVANSESNYLFSYIGYNGDDTTVIYGIENLDTGLVTSMQCMFRYCRNLANLDVSNFDTSNVTDMSYMFYDCEKITNLDVSKFNTSRVIDMSYMFSYCEKLTNLDVSEFDTSNVTEMQGMFRGCGSLTSIDATKFDTSNVTSMYQMFHDCNSLTNLDVSKFNTGSVINMSYMFSDCEKLTNLDVSNFDTSNVTNMSDMFGSCSSLTSLDVSNFSTINVTDMSQLFSSCRSLTSIDLSNFETSSVTNMRSMFFGCNRLTSLDLSKFDITNVTSYDTVFSGVPTTIIIKTNESTATWIKTNFTNITDSNIELIS